MILLADILFLIISIFVIKTVFPVSFTHAVDTGVLIFFKTFGCTAIVTVISNNMIMAFLIKMDVLSDMQTAQRKELNIIRLLSLSCIVDILRIQLMVFAVPATIVAFLGMVNKFPFTVIASSMLLIISELISEQGLFLILEANDVVERSKKLMTHVRVMVLFGREIGNHLPVHGIHACAVYVADKMVGHVYYGKVLGVGFLKLVNRLVHRVFLPDFCRTGGHQLAHAKAVI